MPYENNGVNGEPNPAPTAPALPPQLANAGGQEIRLPDPDGLDDMASPVSELHAAAREHADAGMPVFPCIPEAKQPAVEGGFHRATTDRAQIDRWWTENPAYNIGLYPEGAGLCVVDLDTGAQIENLELPQTFTVQTPSGGKHLYYTGSLPTSARKLAPRVDTRGIGGYVLAPPSVIGGKRYSLIDECDPVPVPESIAATLAVKADKVGAAVEELDLPGNINSARTLLRDYARAGNVAVAGSGGNTHTYKLACKLVRDFGLTAPTALALMEDSGWNDACVPPWSRGELVSIVNNALNYGQNDQGAYATRPAAETFPQEVLAKLAQDTTAKEDAILPNKTDAEMSADKAEQAERAARRAERAPVSIAESMRRRGVEFWDADRKQIPKLPNGAVIVLWGMWSTHKTGISIRNVTEFSLAQGTRVAYLIGEGNDMFGRRVAAACEAQGASGDDLTPDLFQQFDYTPQFNNPECMSDVQFYLDRFQPQIIVIDTLSTALAGENLSAAEVMTKAFVDAKKLAKRCKATVIIVHHATKEGDTMHGSGLFSGLLDGELQAVLVSSKPGEDIIKCVSVKMRDGEKNRAVYYRSSIVQCEGANVPRVEPVTGAASNVVQLNEEREKRGKDNAKAEKTRELRKRVARALLALNAIGDPRTKGVKQELLAEQIVKMSRQWPSRRLDPREQHAFNEECSTWNTRLKNNTRARSDGRSLLWGYYEDVLPHGAKASAPKVRRWCLPPDYVPPEDDELPDLAQEPAAPFGNVPDAFNTIGGETR